MIDENNFKQVLFDYACEKYGQKFQEFYDKFFDKFPYDYGGLSEDLHFKNFIDWFMIEKPLPETGKTIIEEFIDKHPELDEEMKQNLSCMKNVIRSEFIVISKEKLKLKLKDKKTQKYYDVLLYSDVSYVGRNSLISGRIHPFGDAYRFAGAFLTHNSPMILDPDVLMDMHDKKSIKNAESIILSDDTKLTAIFNKYPFQWVDGICEELSIDASGKKNVKAKMIASKLQDELRNVLDSIPKKSKDVLTFILNEGGFVRYNKLKDYDDEVTFWWNEEPPTSTIGILRLKGLLAVGRIPMLGRMHKVALIPKDIREEIQSLL